MALDYPDRSGGCLGGAVERAGSDRQVLLLYLEDLDAAAIGEITGLSPGAIAVKIHRAKAVLARRFNQGEGR